LGQGQDVSDLPLDRPVVLLSHRSPVGFARDEEGRRTVSRGAGGLVTALAGLAGRLGRSVWVAVAAGGEDAEVARESAGGTVRLALEGEPRLVGPDTDAGEADDPGRTVELHLVEVPEQVHTPFYGVVANPLLWFVQHRLHPLASAPSLGRADRAAFEDGYVVVNEQVADAVVTEVERLGGRAVVMLHDYHFYLVGALVRKHCPDTVITHFVHIPWPGPDAWLVLPPDIRERLLRGLLGCDVIGFHTRGDARNFLLCVQELLGLPVDLESRQVDLGDRRVRVRTYPISIDVPSLEQVAGTPEVGRQLARLEAELGDRQLVLRVDRTDPSKNIVRGFEAFGLLLDEHPELLERVVFLAVLQPSRQDVPEYAEHLDEIGASAARVNARHGTGDWQPVDLRFANSFPLAVAAYRRCDVLVVNAVADGMNLVAKEAVVVNRRGMVLALSEATGSHDELGMFATTLHPFDVAQQADALHACLTMPPEERTSRLGMASAVVRRNDVARWLQAQLDDVQELLQDERTVC